METTHYDAIVVGSGAGGCAVAHRLALAGRRVLLLEKGDALPEDGSTLDPQRVLAQGAFNATERWRDRDGRPFVPEEHFNLGGKTCWYGAALLRFGDDEFAPDPVRGFLPWPLSYSELAPYYDQAERLLRTRQFPVESDLARIGKRLRADGWSLQPLQLGLAAEIVAHPELATRFDGFALPGGYKADAPSRLLRPLAGCRELTVVTGADVVDLIPASHDPRQIAGVRCADGRSFHGSRVILAAGALHSPRLLQHYLQRSGIDGGLGVAQTVGRHYKRHVLSAVLGFSLRVQHDRLRKTALLLHRRFPHSCVQPLGGWIDREIVRTLFPRFVPRFFVELFARRVYGFFLQTEDGSDERNRVEYRGEQDPVLDYDLDRLPHAGREHRGLVRALVWSLLKAGWLPIAKRIPLAGSAHSVGTLAAGDDPARSAVDADGRVHGFDNLYVADGSVLPRIGRFNPALTIYACDAALAARPATAHQPLPMETEP
jgi:choline dehydrogenase-like flavoprotein